MTEQNYSNSNVNFIESLEQLKGKARSVNYIRLITMQYRPGIVFAFILLTQQSKNNYPTGELNSEI